MQQSQIDSISLAEGDDATLAGGRPSVRKWLLLSAKLLLSIGLLGLMARSMDWSDIRHRLETIEAGWLTAAFACLVVMIGLVGLRWHLVLAGLGARISFRLAMRVTLIGLFFGQFLPAAVGSDAVRGWFAYRAGVAVSKVAGALVLDRALGLLALVALILLGLPLLATLAPTDLAAAVFGVAAALGSVIVLGLMVDKLPWPAQFRQGRRGRLLAWIAGLRRYLWSRAAAPAFLASVAIHVAIVLSVSVITVSLALPVGLLGCFAVVPTAILLANLPLSLNGWGVREGAMVVGFGLLGVPGEDAFLVSVLFGLGMALITVPGAFVWLRFGRRR